MGTVRYTVLDGEIVSESRNGVIRDYVPDPLGSTVALLDSTQTITDTFTYFPSGTVASRTGTTATPFQFVGTKGYHADTSGKTYVRARVLEPQKGRWLTEDPIGTTPDEGNLYRYVGNRPALFRDPSGLQSADPCSPSWAPPGVQSPGQKDITKCSTRKCCNDHFGSSYCSCMCQCSLETRHLSACVEFTFMRCCRVWPRQSADYCLARYWDDIRKVNDIAAKCESQCLTHAGGGIRPDNPCRYFG